jgi:hypothetical protein
MPLEKRERECLVILRIRARSSKISSEQNNRQPDFQENLTDRKIRTPFNQEVN